MEIRKERIDRNSKSNTQAMETEKIPRILAKLAIPAVGAATFFHQLQKFWSVTLHWYTSQKRLDENLHFMLYLVYKPAEKQR